MNSLIVAFVVLVAVVGISLVERRRFMAKLQVEHDATVKSTLSRMEAELIRITNKMQHDHEVELAKVANSSHMHAVVDQQPVYVNVFIHGQTEHFN